jgi:membrane protein DedA with SNARE-associated domain
VPRQWQAGDAQCGKGDILVFESLAEWVASVIQTLGYPGLTILVALETVFPPIPSEVILPFSGFLTGQGRFSFPAVLLATTAGSLAGALLLYGIGARVGQRRVHRFIARYGHWALLTPADLARAEAWFDRYGAVAVFTGRLVPVVRSLVSIPAGYSGMPLGRFVVLTGAGSALWNGTLVALGWVLGENWTFLERYVGWLQYAVIALVAVVVIRFVWQRLGTRKAA